MRTNSLMRFNLLIFLSIICITAKGQIKIYQSDMFGVGDNFVMAFDYAPIVTPGPAGANQTWNFSALNVSNDDTLFGVNPSSTLNGNYFPTATIADTNSHGGDYFVVTPTSYSQIGGYYNHVPNFELYYNNPAERYLALPAQYHNKGSESFGSVAKEAIGSYPGYDSVMYIYHCNYIDTVDAWGIMTTPYGTDSVLRDKGYFTSMDTVFLQPNSSTSWVYYASSPSSTTIGYYWWSNKIRHWDVEMAVDSNNNPTSVAWVYSSVPNGINEINSHNSLIVYPNPAKSEVTFEISSGEIGSVNIYDIAGRKVQGESVENKIANINTSKYPAGIYLYEIMSTATNVAVRGTFSVIK
jgi:hypothetical protein